jgi:CHAD domain-containing protein
MRVVFENFAARLGRWIVEGDREAVHQLRIACRKVEAVLRLFPKRRRRGVEKVVKGLRRRCGVVRDEQLLSGAASEAAEQELAGYVKRHLGDFRWRVKRLARPKAGRVARRLEKLGRQCEDLGQQVLQRRPRVEAVHELRIVLKRMRYTVEAVYGLEDVEEVGALAPLVPAQKLLGAFMDGVLRGKPDWRALAEFRRLWRQGLAERVGEFVGVVVKVSGKS